MPVVKEVRAWNKSEDGQYAQVAIIDDGGREHVLRLDRRALATLTVGLIDASAAFPFDQETKQVDPVPVVGVEVGKLGLSENVILLFEREDGGRIAIQLEAGAAHELAHALEDVVH